MDDVPARADGPAELPELAKPLEPAAPADVPAPLPDLSRSPAVVDETDRPL